MTTRNFNLRGLPPELLLALKQEAENQRISVNSLILKMIEQGIGHAHEYIRPKYRDLDKLAGTWSENDAHEFSSASAPFEAIDEDLWK